MLRALAAAGLLAAAAASCASTTAALTGCLARDVVVAVTDGPQSLRYRPTDDLEHATVDARGAVWRNEDIPSRLHGDGTVDTTPWRYPVVIDSQDDAAGSALREDVCFVGGHIESAWPDEPGLQDVDTPYSWHFWHDTTGLLMEGPDPTVIGTTLVRQGDGISFRHGDITVRGVYMAEIHDDCIQNDNKRTALVSDTFLDGCYVAFSAQLPGTSGVGETWTIEASLVRLQVMQASWYRPEDGVYRGPEARTFFKWDDDSPALVIRDSMFRTDAVSPAFDFPADATCEGTNVFVWGGDGPVPPLPDAFTDCFRVTTDTSLWDQAAAAWHEAHPRPLL